MLRSLGLRRTPLRRRTHRSLDRQGYVDGNSVAETGVFCLAAADLPVDDPHIARLLMDRGWARQVIVRDDTFDMLRADLIREGLETYLRSRHAEPRLPLFVSGKPDLAENVDEFIAGFGEE